MSIDEKAYAEASSKWLSEIRDIRAFIEAYEAGFRDALLDML